MVKISFFLFFLSFSFSFRTNCRSKRINNREVDDGQACHTFGVHQGDEEKTRSIIKGPGQFVDLVLSLKGVVRELKKRKKEEKRE